MAAPLSTAPAPSALTGLARKLVADQLLSEDQAREFQLKAGRSGQPFVAVVVESKTVSALRIAELASADFGAPLLDLAAIDIDPSLLKDISERVLRKTHALPVYKRSNTLFVAVSDPTNLAALDEIKFATRTTTEAVVVEEDKLAKAIDAAAQRLSAASMDIGMGDADLENIDISDPGAELPDVTKSDADEAPIVRYVHKIMLDAIGQGASDIHFEPYEKSYRIRYRKDGELRTVATPPIATAMRLSARVKVMSRMDLAERRVPQDGRIKLNLSRSKAIDFRVSTCPTLWGEKIVCRILDPTSAQLGIDALGYEPEQKDAYMRALDKPQGMILVTGPTGSGKTVSLYTGLNILNQDDVNISTAEDPAEINLPGINQVNVNPKVGLTFAAALKAFLRQDPDVIMVGEIRDPETAEIAVKAAHTGHLVLSTLHTNRATAALTRLASLGIPAFLLATSVTLISAQRLVRRLCSDCKRPVTMTEQQLLQRGFAEAELQDLQLFEAAGCVACHAGYRGRLGIHEVVPIGERLARAILEGGSAGQLAELAAREGHADLHRAGRDVQVVTTLSIE